MKSYLKLVNFEVNRFLKLYIILMAVVSVLQIAAIALHAYDYMRTARETIRLEGLVMQDFIRDYELYSFENVAYSAVFTLSIVFGFAVLLIYVFLIWYRDWFGKSKFIYRLLMLPTPRRHIYFAKLTAILLFILGLLALQQVLIFIGQPLAGLFVEEAFRNPSTGFAIYKIDILAWLFPKTFVDFVLIYGFGALCVAVTFMLILLERSYQLKGIMYGIVYVIGAGVLLISPLLFNEWVMPYFYPMELFGLMAVASLIVLGTTIWIADHVLTYKIKV